MSNLFYSPGWEDLQVNVGRVRFPGTADPTWRQYDHGISGGVSFDVLGFAVNDYIEFDAQTPHSMQLNSTMVEHIHFIIPTDGTGKKFKFQLDVIAAGLDVDFAVPTGSPFTAEQSMTTDLSSKHSLLNVATIPAANVTVSTLYTMKLTRIAASADEYSGEVYIKYIDGHIRIDGIGSKSEDSKN